MKKIIVITLLATSAAMAQNNTHALFFEDAFPTFYSNPARPMPHRLVIGIPGLSSVYAGVVFTPASAYDVFRSDQTPQQSIDNIIDNLGGNERLNASMRQDLLAVGFPIGKGFLLLDAGYNVDYNFQIPSTLIKFLRFGNAAYIGETYTIDDLKMEAVAYARLGVGFQYPINDKLTLGIKANYLSGIGNFTTKRSQADIYTDVDITQITTDFRFESAGVNLFDDDFKYRNPYADDRVNHGFSVDFGGHYKWSDRWDFSASVLNLGGITWRQNANAYLSNGTIDWEGFEYDLSSENPEASFDNYIDSLSSALNFERREIDKYSSFLPTRFLLGGQYHFNKMHSLGLSYEGAVYRSKLYHNVGLTYIGRYSKWFHLLGGYSGVGANFTNVSVGMTLNLGAYQLFLMTDNLIDGIDYLQAKSTTVRLGMNLCFGDRTKPKEKKVKKEKKVEPIETEEQF